MTSLAGSDEQDGPEPSQRYCVPRRATVPGRRAFHAVVRGWAAQLAEQMEIDAQRSGHDEPEYTAIQVHDARRAVERQNALRVEPDRSDHRLLAAILLTVGPLGISVLSNFLVGPWQVLSFAVFVVVLVVGLVLMWTGRTRTAICPARHESRDGKRCSGHDEHDLGPAHLLGRLARRA